MSNRELSLIVNRFGQGALRSKHKLSLNVETFGQGALRSKLKLSLNVTFVGNFFQANDGLVNIVTIAAPDQAREGDRSGKVRLG